MPHSYRFCFVPLLVLIGYTGTAFAQTASDSTSASSQARSQHLPGAPSKVPQGGWFAISDARLAAVRGGFDLGNGLQASFGIARAIYVNGNLVTFTNVTIPDVAHITSQQATQLVAATSSMSLVQNGPGNSFDPTALNQGVAATVIQNTLNNQTIRTMTTINVSVNTLNALQGSNLQNTLQAAQLQTLGH